ncbi:MAG: cld [Dehalococcoidia bacterium]|nr:cld [Dehalococcoidia bacterium]
MVEQGQRQYVKFSFYKVDNQWRRLPLEEKQRDRDEFLAAVTEAPDGLMVQSYNLQGTRGDVDLMLWTASQRLEDLQELAISLNFTGLGRYLTQPHSYLAMTRRSMYIESHRHPGQEGSRLRVKPTGSRYLFVYPFVKTNEWYQLPKDVRQEMMNEHFQVGHKYPSIRINTTYSYGLDDPEFVLAFETDKPEDFLNLIMDLRESKARPYTLRDTPIFTCVAADLEEILGSLG